MRISYNWLQTYFDSELPEPEALAELLTFHAFEVEGVEKAGNDTVLDVDVLANRSSDCLSHRGIARELSVLLSVPLKKDPLRESLPAWEEPEGFTVLPADDTDLSPRHMAAVVRGVTVGPSPQWLQDRVRALGQRPINNIVDATNFVMYDLGQPVHAFDLDKIEAEDGARRIQVTPAKEGEQITLLGGEVRTLRESHLVIRDLVSGYALDVAGIKGGAQAELTSDTVDIVVDCANFNYLAVRKASRELKLSTDASTRFQNEPSPHLAAFAMRDVLALIRDVAGGQLVGVVDRFTEPPSRAPVRTSLQDINSVLGTDMTVTDMENILVRFEYEFSRDEEHVTVTPPWERSDLNIPADLIEEIGRVYGYNNITGVLPEAPTSPVLNKRFFYEEKTRHLLNEMGYSEVYTYTLREKGEVSLVNPLAADKGCLRSTLREGVEDALTKNTATAPLLGLDTLKVFELGPVFRQEGEYLALALGTRAVTGKQKKAEVALAADIENLSQALGTELVGKTEDGIFETIFEAALPDLPEPVGYLPALPYRTDARFTMWSVYPYVLRDLALWVPEGVLAEEPLAVIVATASDLLVRHDLFDEFSKEGKTSYAFHLVWQAVDRTLTDEEVGKEMQAVEAALRERGWEVR